MQTKTDKRGVRNDMFRFILATLIGLDITTDSKYKTNAKRKTIEDQSNTHTQNKGLMQFNGMKQIKEREREKGRGAEEREDKTDEYVKPTINNSISFM